MEDTGITKLLNDLYPKAKTCLHKQTIKSIEKEPADDTINYIFVERCVDCSLPIADRYATIDEVIAYDF